MCSAWRHMCRQELYMTRFMQEAELMASLKHPNIQGLFGVCACVLTCLTSQQQQQQQLTGFLRGVFPVTGACVFPFALITEYATYGSLSDIVGSPPVRAELSSCAYSRQTCLVVGFVVRVKSRLWHVHLAKSVFHPF